VSKPNKYWNPGIRELRKIIGDTQKKFASRLGYTEDFIYSVEKGRCGVSKDFLEKIRLATGAFIHPNPAMWGRIATVDRKGNKVPHSFVKVLTWDKSWNASSGDYVLKYLNSLRNYTRADFESWQKRFDGTPESGRANFESVREHLEILFMAAAKAHRPAPALLCSLNDWIRKSAKDFNLEPLIKTLRQERESANPQKSVKMPQSPKRLKFEIITSPPPMKEEFEVESSE
jgi:transcriptional regulator with XRE-family HTH domain